MLYALYRPNARGNFLCKACLTWCPFNKTPFPVFFSCLRIIFVEEELDEEEVYKMAAIMSSSGGLEAMLSRYYTLTL